MTSRPSQAVFLKHSGQCNCAQAVAVAYADVAGMDVPSLMESCAAFGGGMGCMEGTCGALVGAGVVLGHCHKDRARAMKAMRSVVTQFKQRNGCTVCRELKGVGTGQPVRECDDCVADACEFLEGELEKTSNN